MQTIYLRITLLSLFLSLGFTRMILPSQIPLIEATQSLYLNPSLKTQQSPTDGNSTVNPVPGIANTTSGYLSVDDPNSFSKLFYIFYQCRGLASGQAPSDVPIIIWIQGGPGVGSEDSAFYEMGPYALEYNETTGKYQEVPREVSWNDYYNLLFIDNPRGAGLSIADKGTSVTNEDEISQDLLMALLNFYDLQDFQQFKKTPLYIFGDSFAGHYVPSFAKKVLDYNKAGQLFQLPLSGIGIGNGYVDPINQFANNGLFGFSQSLIDNFQREEIESLQINGISSIYNGNYTRAQQEFDQAINLIASYGGGVNVYNYRQFDSYNFSAVTAFFNDEDTVKRYGVDPSVAGHFVDVNVTIFNTLINDTMQSVTDTLISVIEAGIQVLVYAGQDDLICNSPSIQNWVANLPWAGQLGFYNAPLNVWVYQNGTIAGFQKNHANFYFAVVNKAGHLAPMDQIETTTEMVRRFVNKQLNWTLPLGSGDSSEEAIVA